MIKNELIIGLVSEAIKDSELFLVSCSVSSANKITIKVDTFDGVSIQDCVKLSRAIEEKLDREADDFSLDVSSPGLVSAFKVREQYLKNIDNQVDIVLKGGIKLRGVLTSVSEKGIELDEEVKVKVEGKNKKELIIKKREVDFSEIKTTKRHIAF